MSGSPVIPALRYRDAAAAVDWLCAAFGFERRLVVPGESGNVRHAQLVLGTGMVMVSSGAGGEFDALVKPPSATGAVCTQAAYIVVDDCEAHHARAAAAGAEIVIPPEEQPQGGSLYTCRDPEGHVWSFGSYDPWA